MFDFLARQYSYYSSTASMLSWSALVVGAVIAYYTLRYHNAFGFIILPDSSGNFS